MEFFLNLQLYLYSNNNDIDNAFIEVPWWIWSTSLEVTLF